MNRMVDVNKNLTTSGNVLTITAADGNVGAVGGIDNYHGVGNYLLKDDSSNYISLTFNNKTYYLTGGSVLAPFSHGELYVAEEHTNGNFKNTRGTFSGVAYANSTDSVTITGGVFKDDDF
jgi:hypothetical protein